MNALSYLNLKTASSFLLPDLTLSDFTGVCRGLVQMEL